MLILRDQITKQICIVVRMFFRHDLSHAQALILLVNNMHKRAISAPAAESFYGSGNAKGNFFILERRTNIESST